MCRYRLEQLLGIGSTGPVWLAVDRELGAKRALKFLDEALRSRESELESLKQETLRCQQLTHQNIVRIYDFVCDEEHAAIAMEYVEGPDLRAALNNRVPPVFDVDEVRFWIEELCRALHYAHTFASIIHRDIKPSNLLVTAQGNLKVADFGIARVLERNRNSNEDSQVQLAGTWNYVSPEQTEGKRPSVADDIYSFGATLFELLSGRPPFIGDNLDEQVLCQPVPSLSSFRTSMDEDRDPVPSDWAGVIEACLAKDPTDRPDSIRAVADVLGLELRQVTMHEPVLPTGFSGGTARRKLANGGVSAIDALPVRQTNTRNARTLRDLPDRVQLTGGKIAKWLGVAVTSVAVASMMVTLSKYQGDETDQSQASSSGGDTPLASNDQFKQQSAADLGAAWLAVRDAVKASSWEQARGRLAIFLKDQPQNLQIRLTEAEVELSLGNPDRAVDLLRAILTEMPSNLDAAVLKAKAHFIANQWQQTVRATDWVLALQKTVGWPDILRMRGRANRRLGNINEAIGDFTRAYRLDPTNAETFYWRAMTYRDENNLKQALNDLHDAVALDGSNTTARTARAYIAMQEGNHGTTVIEDLSYGINADAENLHLRFDRLRCHEKAKNWSAVLSDSEYLLSKKPDWAEVKVFKERAKKLKGTDQEVEVAATDPNRKSQSNLKSYAEELELAGQLLEEGNPADAIQKFDEVIAQDPKRYLAYQGRAYAYYAAAKKRERAGLTKDSLRHEMRRLGLLDVELLQREAPELVSADTYLLKSELFFDRGEYPKANAAAKAGRTRFPNRRGEFNDWLAEIAEAEGFVKPNANRPLRTVRPPAWMQRIGSMFTRIKKRPR